MVLRRAADDQPATGLGGHIRLADKLAHQLFGLGA
jgi:hypothetical protein